MEFKHIIQIRSFLMFMLCAGSLYAQEEQRRTTDLSGITKNVIIGYAYSDFAVTPHHDIKSNFTRMGYSPTMIWKLGEKLFFESQVEFYTDSDNVKTQVEYAKLSYIYNRYITIGMGKILTPFGMYTERFEAPFIERLPNAPIGFRHSDGSPNIGPVGSEMGFDIRGGFQVGDAKMNYVFYVTNGARLNDGILEPNLAGSLEYENFYDNNSNKAFGSRIGYLPFSNSSLEFGASVNYCKVGNVNTSYQQLTAQAYAFDFSYHKPVHSIKSIINLKGQANYLMVDRAIYTDEAGGAYSFENVSYIGYFRCSIRPAFVKNHFLKRTEFLYRYNYANLAKDALWGGLTTRTDIGFSYWLSVRTGLRVAFEETHLPNGSIDNAVLVRFVTGF